MEHQLKYCQFPDRIVQAKPCLRSDFSRTLLLNFIGERSFSMRAHCVPRLALLGLAAYCLSMAGLVHEMVQNEHVLLLELSPVTNVHALTGCLFPTTSDPTPVSSCHKWSPSSPSKPLASTPPRPGRRTVLFGNFQLLKEACESQPCQLPHSIF
jgi:hypothetical protein